MHGGPDRFDPLMDVGTAKSMGSEAAPVPDAATGNTLAEPFDGAANFGTVGADIVFPGPTLPLASDGVQRQPADVDRFGG